MNQQLAKKISQYFPYSKDGVLVIHGVEEDKELPSGLATFADCLLASSQFMTKLGFHSVFFRDCRLNNTICLSIFTNVALAARVGIIRNLKVYGRVLHDITLDTSVRSLISMMVNIESVHIDSLVLTQHDFTTAIRSLTESSFVKSVHLERIRLNIDASLVDDIKTCSGTILVPNLTAFFDRVITHVREKLPKNDYDFLMTSWVWYEALRMVEHVIKTLFTVPVSYECGYELLIEACRFILELPVETDPLVVLRSVIDAPVQPLVQSMEYHVQTDAGYLPCESSDSVLLYPASSRVVDFKMHLHQRPKLCPCKNPSFIRTWFDAVTLPVSIAYMVRMKPVSASGCDDLTNWAISVLPYSV